MYSNEKKINNLSFNLSLNEKTRKNNKDEILVKYIKTTPGRILLNQAFQ